jgi:hypothetical protein
METKTYKTPEPRRLYCRNKMPEFWASHPETYERNKKRALERYHRMADEKRAYDRMVKLLG